MEAFDETPNDNGRKFLQDLRNLLERSVCSLLRLSDLLLQHRHELDRIGWLHEVVVNLLSDRPQGRVKIWVTSNNERSRMWLNAPHGTDDRKTVAGFAY